MNPAFQVEGFWLIDVGAVAIDDALAKGQGKGR